jgi:hypothetical protein
MAFFKRNSYSCYDFKQPSKVNFFVYFLPAVGWEKVIKIRHFSNETAIYVFCDEILVLTDYYGLIYNHQGSKEWSKGGI